MAAPPGRAIRRCSGDSFELVWGDPEPRLRGLVRGYQGFRETNPLRRREVPSRDVTLILDLGQGWRLFDPADPSGQAKRFGSFLAGLDDRPWTVKHDGDARCLQVDLTPVGARALLGVPMHELARRVVALEDLLGREATSLLERLHAAPSWEARFDLLDVALAARLARAAAPRPDVVRAWRRLEETHGCLTISALADELGCTRRHLAARFRDDVGLSPKTLARVLRFRRAVDLLEGDQPVHLAEVAASCGYFDQPHFNRDFGAFAGVTPTELLARRLPQRAGVAA